MIRSIALGLGLLGVLAGLGFGGHYWWEVGRFQELLEAGIDCLMPDVKYCGGLSVAMAVDDLASARGGSVAPHNPSGPIATLASVHACAAMSAFETLEYQWGEVADPERLLTPHVPSTGGTIPVSHLPGLGRSLDHDALRDIQIPIDRGGRV